MRRRIIATLVVVAALFLGGTAVIGQEAPDHLVYEFGKTTTTIPAAVAERNVGFQLEGAQRRLSWLTTTGASSEEIAVAEQRVEDLEVSLDRGFSDETVTLPFVHVGRDSIYWTAVTQFYDTALEEWVEKDPVNLLFWQEASRSQLRSRMLNDTRDTDGNRWEDVLGPLFCQSDSHIVGLANASGVGWT